MTLEKKTTTDTEENQRGFNSALGLDREVRKPNHPG